MALVGDDDDIPKAFLCPITLLIMKDPVSLRDGHSYENEAIERWFRTGHTTSPVTNLPLGSLTRKRNHALRNAIEEWLNQRPGLIDEKQAKQDWEFAVQLYLREAESRLQKLSGVGGLSSQSGVAQKDYVETWLEKLGYQTYWKTFQENGFATKEELLTINEENLKEMKVRIGHANRILDEKNKIVPSVPDPNKKRKRAETEAKDGKQPIRIRVTRTRTHQTRQETARVSVNQTGFL